MGKVALTLGLFYLAGPSFGFVPNSHPSFHSIISREQQHQHQQYHQTKTIQTRLEAVTLDGKEIRGPITPLGNFVLVKVKETLSATDGGILLPDQAKERPTEGEVVAAGPGKLHPHTGVRIHCPVQPGMSVLHGKFDGTKLMYNDEEMNMIRDDDVMLYYSSSKSMTLENVVPCRDYILVENDASTLETESGIVVAGSVTKGLEPCEGNVIKVGEGRMCSTGEFTPSPVQVGDRVKFRDYAGNAVRIQGKDHSLVRMVDILCAIPPEQED